MKSIEVVMPIGALGASVADTLLDSAMRAIARAIDPSDKNWGTKYGNDFENKTFSMHRECWCGNNCKKCRTPNFIHKKSGFAVTWYKYIGRSMEINRKITEKQLGKIVGDCIKSLRVNPKFNGGK